METKVQVGFYIGLVAIFIGLILLATAVGFGGKIIKYDSSQRSPSDTESEQRKAEFQFDETSNLKGLNYSAKNAYRESTSSLTNAGVYVVDYNRDQWMDVLVTGGNGPVLFENTDGRFSRSNAIPTVNRSIQSALFFDYNNDGWSDLLLLSLNSKPLMLENRNGSFEEVSVGFDRRLSTPTGASAADFDQDGCLDLFIVQNGNWSENRPQGFERYVVDPNAGNGNTNFLYRGNCSSFDEVTKDTGISGSYWSLATSFVDLNNDSYPDIHIANDFNRDTIYLNTGSSEFERYQLGSFLNISDRKFLGPNTNRNAMSSEIMDLNGDGVLDIFVTNIYLPQSVTSKEAYEYVHSEGNNVFIGVGNGTFVERSDELGLLKGGWGWAAIVEDIDNDADEDIFHTTMEVSFSTMAEGVTVQDIKQILDKYSFYRYPVVIENMDEGFQYREPKQIGLDRSDGRGVGQFDFDNDGDIDIVLANATGSFKLYENKLNGGSAIQIRLRRSKNNSLIGARVFVTADQMFQMEEYNTKSDFLSQDSRVLHFGTDSVKQVSVRIVWPDRETQTFSNVSTGQRIVVTRNGIDEKIQLVTDEESRPRN